MSKFFPLNLSKFKRVSSDKHTTTLKHDDGHEVKIAHGVLSPKLRGHLAALPEHKEEIQEMSDGGEATSTPIPETSKKKAKEFEKGATASGWDPAKWKKNIKEGLGMAEGGAVDQTPNSMMVENPNYVPGGPQPQYMPREALEGDKPLEQPFIDPISLAATVATGGASSIGPTVLNAVKNKATSAATGSLLGGIKAAAAARQQRMSQSGMTQKAEPSTLIGKNSVYTETPVTAYSSQNVKDMFGRYDNMAQGGEVEGPNNSKLAESEKLPMYADGGELAQPQMEAPQVGAPITEQQQQPTQADPDLQAKRNLYNQEISISTGKGRMIPPGTAFGANGEVPEKFDALAWDRAEAAHKAQQQQKMEDSQEASKSLEMENSARQRAGLPPLATSQQTMAQAATPVSQTQAPPTPAQQQGMVAAATGQDQNSQNQMMGTFQQGLEHTQAGIANEARALGAQGAAEANLLQESIQQKQDAQQYYQEHYNALDQERQGFQQDIVNQHIDPNHYMSSMGTSGRISTGIGLILGGIGGGLTHQENPALKFLNAQIDRDIHSQVAELGKKENLLSANMRQFGNLKDATEMTRIMQNDIVSMQLKQAAAKAMDPLAKARAMQASGKLDMDTAQLQGQMANRLTVQNAVGLIQKDPSKAQQIIGVIQNLDPKRAEELQKHLVPGVGLAPTPDDAKLAKEALSRRESIQQNIMAVREMIKKKGTYELTGSHNQDLDRRIDQIATDMAKLQDPNSVARPGEVELVKKTLAGPGVFKRDATALKVMENFSKEVDKRTDTMLRSHGLAPQDPITKLTGQQKTFAEWARKNPNNPKAVLILKKLGLD